MTVRPPRPQRREPFRVASDFIQPPADDYVEPHVQTEEEPFPLHSEYVPTLTDLSQQIGAVSSHLVVLHRESALMHGEVKDVAKDVRELRGLVTGDHAPRITAVEQVERQSRIMIPPGVKRGAVKGAVGLGLASIYPVAEALLPLVRKLIEGQ